MYYELEVKFVFPNTKNQVSKYFNGQDIEKYVDSIIDELKLMRNGNVIISGIDFIISKDTKTISKDDEFIKRYSKWILFEHRDNHYTICSYSKHIINMSDLLAFLESFKRKEELC